MNWKKTYSLFTGLMKAVETDTQVVIEQFSLSLFEAVAYGKPQVLSKIYSAGLQDPERLVGGSIFV